MAYRAAVCAALGALRNGDERAAVSQASKFPSITGSDRRIARPDSPGRGECGSEAGFVFGQRLPQAVEHRFGVVADFAHAVGPLSLDRGDRIAPGSELVRRQLVDLVARLGEQLGVAGELEVGPRSEEHTPELQSPM